jgi:hypothetical protein
MEKLGCVGIVGCGVASLDTFTKIASAASECEVDRLIRSTSAQGADMFYFKGEIEDNFWRTAIFATMVGPIGHECIQWIHRLADFLHHG